MAREQDCTPPSPDESPLIRKISEALRRSTGTALRVSITKDPEWIPVRNGAERIWAKSLCWNLTLPSGEQTTEPVLALVHGDLTEESLGAGLRAAFPQVAVTIDNDIEFR